METFPGVNGERLGPREPGPTNPINDHRWSCLCPECMAFWGTAADRSIRRLWEDAHQDDDAAAERAQHVDAESRRRDVPRTADLQRGEADEEGWGEEDGERYRSPGMYST